LRKVAPTSGPCRAMLTQSAALRHNGPSCKVCRARETDFPSWMSCRSPIASEGIAFPASLPTPAAAAAAAAATGGRGSVSSSGSSSGDPTALQRQACCYSYKTGSRTRTRSTSSSRWNFGSLIIPAAAVACTLLLSQPCFCSGAALQTLGKQDLFTQEMEELDSLAQLAEERRGLVSSLRDQVLALSDNTNTKATKADRAKAAVLLSPLASIQATSSSPLAGSAAAQDSLTELASGSLPSDGVLSTWLPAGPSRDGAPSTIELPEALLVVVLQSGQARLLTPSGVTLKTLNLGHVAPVTLLASVPWTSPMLFATAEANGVVRVHKVKVRVRTMQEMSQDSIMASAANQSHLLGLSMDSALEVSVSLHSSFEVAASASPLGKPSRSSGSTTSLLTALGFAATPDGSRLVVAGDKDGKVSAFQLDGNFASRLDATTMPGTAAVSHFFASQKRLLFVAGDEWGFVDFDGEVVKHVECDNFEPSPPLRMGVFDAAERPTRVHLLDNDGTVWSLLARGARTCSVLRRSSISSLGNLVETLGVASFRDYLLLLARRPTTSREDEGSPSASASGSADSPFISALNFSSVQLEDSRAPLRSLPVIFQRPLPSKEGEGFPMSSALPLLASWRARPSTNPGDENPPVRERDLLASVNGRQVTIYSLQVGVHVATEEETMWLNTWIVIPSIVVGVSSLFFWHYLNYGRAWKQAINGPSAKAPAEADLGSMGGLGGLGGMPGFGGL